MPRRCVFGCPPSEVPMHRFPNVKKFPDMFKSWVILAGGKLESTSDYDYYQKKRVCNIHFSDEVRNRFNRLHSAAIPSLHLPGSSASQTVSEQPLTQHFQHDTIPLPEGSSASQTVSEQPLTQHFQHDTIPLPEGSSASQTVSEQPLTQHFQQDTIPLPEDARCTKSTTSKRLLMEHNYSIISKPRIMTGKGASKTNRTHVQPLYTKIKHLRTEISRVRKRGLVFKERLQNAEKLFEKASFLHVTENMTKPAQLFLHMQLQTPKEDKGRRFSLEEKVLALSLYKKSPKCYGLLHKYFTLPSSKTMKRLLSDITITPGINKIIFEKLKKTVSQLPVTDRLCSLIFDEMSLTPQIFYDAHKDKLDGFATNKNTNFADHVLVFMVKGLKQNFKQPIAYYFTTGLKKIELKELIKTVIKEAHDAGLIIINTVCDQSTVNVGAITELVDETKKRFIQQGLEWRYDQIRLNGKTIIPLYDVPHLIKGIRNNLLTKDMMYNINNEIKIVKWAYFQQLYAADQTHGELKMLYKLTEEHVNPDKINKMRVKSATQIFSHSVAVATEHLTARGDLDVECKNLIDITLLLDKLFDSLNVNTFHIPDGKIYKGPIKKHSPHHKLWVEAKKILKTIKFKVTKKYGNTIRLTETAVPSVQNLIKTIEGIEAIWKILHFKYGFDTFLTRHLNQDPVENFFGNIRSYGARNVAPNILGFEGAFKALLLNNYNSPHSNRANCEEDPNECLQSLDFFLTEQPETTSDISKDDVILCNKDIFVEHNEPDAGQKNYVCGWVLTKCLKNIVKSCQKCRQNLIDKENINANNAYIKKKEYANKKWLCYPSKQLENCFSAVQNVTVAFLKKDLQKRNIKKDITEIADILVDFPFDCESHKDKLKKYFCNTSINLLICSWCRSVNRILAGKITYSGEDEIKMNAQTYHNKHKHCKNKK